MTKPDDTQTETDPLNGPQRRGLIALLEGATVPEAAKRAGVARSTVWKWLQLPVFVTALRHAEDEQLSSAARAMGAKATGAIDLLATIMADQTVPAAVRVRAIDTLLARWLPFREVVSLEARMTAVEAAIDGRGDGR